MFEEGSEAGDSKQKNPYSFLNYILGIITFCLVVYFMSLIRGKKPESKGSYKGKGKGKGFGPLGSSSTGGLFGAKKGGRTGGLGGLKGIGRR